jgi:hypothetical protein
VAAVTVSARRREGPAVFLDALRRARTLVAARHAAFVVALAAGLALMALRAWGLGHSRGLAVKIGLVVFLLVPMEAMHAWTWHGWIARGLRDSTAAAFSRRLERGLGVDEMLRALAVPLLGLGLPLILWLSIARPR